MLELRLFRGLFHFKKTNIEFGRFFCSVRQKAEVFSFFQGVEWTCLVASSLMASVPSSTGIEQKRTMKMFG